MESIPARPADAKDANPTIKMGPNNLKISLFLPKINPEKAVVYVKGTTFHCSTLSQSPKYYVTKDLSAFLRGIELNDEKSVASYERGFLNVVVPLIGSREAIDAARKWAEPEEVQERLANKAAAKRQREEEVAALQQQAHDQERANKNKKKKKNKKTQNSNNNNNNNKNEGKSQVTTNTVSASEGSLTERIAAEAGALSEQKVEAAVKKNQAKEAWLQSKDAETAQKRRKRKGVTDDLRESVKQQVAEKFSAQGKKKANQEKKMKKKEKSGAQSTTKEKKSVKFAN